MAGERPQEGATWRKLLWFVALWGAGVVTIAVVGYVLRAVFFS
jgi:hypothetical protein